MMRVDYLSVSKPSSKVPPSGFPEFAVRREAICKFFDPPMASSTFYDLVDKGIIVPLKEPKGFYRLNESLGRLGLREVPTPLGKYPSALPKIFYDWRRGLSSLLCSLCHRGTSGCRIEEEHAALLAQMIRADIDALPTYQEKIAARAGMLHAQADIERIENGTYR